MTAISIYETKKRSFKLVDESEDIRIMKKGKVNEPFINGYNEGEYIFFAVRTRCLSIVMEIVFNGGNVNVNLEKSGITPLIAAVMNDDLDIVKFLIEKGANIDAKTSLGYCVLFFAMCLPSIKIFRMLIEKGANVNSITNYGESLLTIIQKYHCFMKIIHIPRIELLVKNGAI